MESRKPGIVIVSYNDIIAVEKLKQISPSNGSSIIIVDNTPLRNLEIKEDSVSYIPLLENKGIAEAQNIGIKRAIELGCSHIIFIDQDSIISPDFINSMIDEYEAISKSYTNIFLLGPTVINGRTKEEYKSTIHRDIQEESGFIYRREIISSGSCVKTEKIKSIGLLDNRLFIDMVDFEWCWRANSLGYISGITKNVTLIHFVGQEEYRFFNQLVIVSSPIRYYYQTRNLLWLLRRGYVPLSWKINQILKKIIFSFSYPFYINNWKQIYLQSFRGLIAGLKRQS